MENDPLLAPAGFLEQGFFPSFPCGAHPPSPPAPPHFEALFHNFYFLCLDPFPHSQELPALPHIIFSHSEHFSKNSCAFPFPFLFSDNSHQSRPEADTRNAWCPQIHIHTCPSLNQQLWTHNPGQLAFIQTWHLGHIKYFKIPKKHPVAFSSQGFLLWTHTDLGLKGFPWKNLPGACWNPRSHESREC